LIADPRLADGQHRFNDTFGRPAKKIELLLALLRPKPLQRNETVNKPGVIEPRLDQPIGIGW
jgi:hypothetical protein